MSCSAPGTHGLPEMKTVRNSVLLRLSVALVFRRLKVISGHSRFCLSKPTPQPQGPPARFHPSSEGCTGALDQEPRELPPRLVRGGRVWEKGCSKRACPPSQTPPEGQAASHVAQAPTPGSCPPSVLCTHRRVGCHCLLFSCYPAHLRPGVYKSLCRKNRHVYGTPEGVGIHKKAVSLCGWQRAGKALN